MNILNLSLFFYISAAVAFQDTFPLFAFSSSSSVIDAKEGPVLTSYLKFNNKAEQLLSNCDATTVFIYQPGLQAEDFHSSALSHMKRISLDAVSQYILPYSKERLQPDRLIHDAKSSCSSKLVNIDPTHESFPTLQRNQISVVSMKDLSLDAKSREQELFELDQVIYSLHSTISDDTDFNFFLTSSPKLANMQLLEDDKTKQKEDQEEGEEGPSTIDSNYFLSMNRLRHAQPISLPVESMNVRGNSLVRNQQEQNVTSTEGSLFDRYQFFTPGIFMGYLALAVLVPTLIISCKLLSSIQISYHAFSSPRKKNLSEK
ncbi:BIG1 family ER membrane protein [Schizosaccharomyces cryophilus OY26]|uniref:Protein BIG1 n=1 Tax=Schizosaccharomyces cryophilus (strain OY26 / ATCC MYA-4695 / CBS 11777 / NBRC 106824 / NRRL Y48691) TaxID=653667 RepID=S9VPW1_SCHCR|nr:BIG1 family ER membrane protein [Schizosaccharomyces cryophilus OY26]EPY49988.1 BIG1 family ER membrane protein [Schizosaccharomyces cryophilus OY26]